MHLLLCVASCFIVCINVEAQLLSAQSDGLQAETANAGNSQPDAYAPVPNELPAPKKDDMQPLVQDNSEQQLVLTQKNMAAYPLSYTANRQWSLPYGYPTYGTRQNLYGLSQPDSTYRNYQTPNYISYPYGYGETMEQQSWNSPTQKPEQDFYEYPRPSNQPQGGYRLHFYVHKTIANHGIQCLAAMYMDNWRIDRRDGSHIHTGWGMVDNFQPQSPTAKPKEFEASEERFLAEYSTGSLQESDSGIQLIEEEPTKDQNPNPISSGMGWQNYPITRPAWPLPKPVAPTPFQPIASADSWRGRPYYIQQNNWKRYPNTNVESPEQININKNMCFNNCRAVVAYDNGLVEAPDLITVLTQTV